MMTKMMSLIGGAAMLAACMTSCAGGRADLVNPTQAEMDAADVRWGLKPRQSKGGPRRTVSYDSPMSGGGGASVSAPPVVESPSVAPAPAPAPLPAPAVEPVVDPATINKLR